MELNEAEKNFVDFIVPPSDGIALGFFSIVAWMDEDGRQHWKTHGQVDHVAISSLVGWLDIAKSELILHEVARARRERGESE